MEQITKIVQEIGNGGHIYLPKEMVGQKVVVSLMSKNIVEIEKEILSMLEPYLKQIMGIYLYGSYVRGEETPESDIDVLVVTDGKVKIPKKINEYEIVSISLEELEKSLKHTAVLILPILKEAKTIMNDGLIDKYKKEKLTKENTKWYIESTKTSLAVAKEFVDDEDISTMPNLVYPLVLRLRGLYMIECLVNGNEYSNKKVEKFLMDKGLTKVKQIIKMYREDRDKKRISSNTLDYDDINRLYSVVYLYYQKVRKIWEKLK